MDATYICTVAGIRFFEHPTRGDEAPLLALVNGAMVATDFWESPEAEDVINFLAEVNA